MGKKGGGVREIEIRGIKGTEQIKGDANQERVEKTERDIHGEKIMKKTRKERKRILIWKMCKKEKGFYLTS